MSGAVSDLADALNRALTTNMGDPLFLTGTTDTEMSDSEIKLDWIVEIKACQVATDFCSSAPTLVFAASQTDHLTDRSDVGVKGDH